MTKQEKTKKARKRTKDTVSARGRTFSGTIVKKFPKRVVIEFERTVPIKKYQRYFKKKMKIHARIPMGMNLNIGDYIKVKECRPLSKIIHTIVVEKIKSAEESEK